MLETSNDFAKLAQAMLTVQGGLHGVVRDSTNPHYRNNYASLEAVIDTVRQPLTEAGIWWTQTPGLWREGALEVTTMLVHAESGQWMRSIFMIPLGKQDPQGAGSAITYACRYALMATLGLPPVDDDAEGAVAPREAAKPRAPAPNPLLAKKEEATPTTSALITGLHSRFDSVVRKEEAAPAKSGINWRDWAGTFKRAAEKCVPQELDEHLANHREELQRLHKENPSLFGKLEDALSGVYTQGLK